MVTHPLGPVEMVLKVSRDAIEPAWPTGSDPSDAGLVVAVKKARRDRVELRCRRSGEYFAEGYLTREQQIMTVCLEVERPA
jgi:hypothetical protein